MDRDFIYTVGHLIWPMEWHSKIAPKRIRDYARGNCKELQAKQNRAKVFQKKSR